MLVFKILLVCTSITLGSNSAIPIWELLTQQEKRGRLMYVFSHLVDDYCRSSNIPDCQKLLTLYGMSNLVNEDENSLDQMDPYQRNSRHVIWERVMKGDFRFSPDKSLSRQQQRRVEKEDDYNSLNEVSQRPYQIQQVITKAVNDPHPYAVRVPAPPRLRNAHPTRNLSEVLSGRRTNRLFPAGVQSSADFEPTMSESRRFETRILPPGATAQARPGTVVTRYRQSTLNRQNRQNTPRFP